MVVGNAKTCPRNQKTQARICRAREEKPDERNGREEAVAGTGSRSLIKSTIRQKSSDDESAVGRRGHLPRRQEGLTEKEEVENDQDRGQVE